MAACDRNIVGQDLMRVQYRIARVLFSVQQGKLLVLHGFIKKSQKTPNEDLTLALRRKREFEP
jgi:phage-related protein